MTCATTRRGPAAAPIHELIADAGTELRLLVYLLELNPMGMAFAQLKAHLRKGAGQAAPAL